MKIPALRMAHLELCFKYNFNLYNITPTLINKSPIISLTVHTPKGRKCLKVLFVKFVFVNIQNGSRDKITHYNYPNAHNLAQYDITQSN